MTIDSRALYQALEEATAHHQAQRWPEAERLYRAILQEQPHHPHANHNLGVMAVQLGKPEAALPHLRLALEQDPDQRQYWISYIEALCISGQIPTANNVIEEGRKRGLPGELLDVLRARIEDKSRSAEPRQDTSASDLPDKTSDLFATARRFHQEGKLVEAEQLYRVILARDARHADSWHLLGVAAYQNGQYELAVKMISNAIDIAGDVATFHINLGNALQAQGKLEQAIASCERALSLNANSPQALYNRGNALTQMGKLQDALASFEQAVLVKPDYAEAHSNLGNLLESLGRHDDAVASYRHALAINPDLAAASTGLGNVLQLQGKLAEAVSCYQRALSNDPSSPAALLNIGHALRKLGKPAEAAAYYRQALSVQSDSAEALAGLGDVLHEEGDIDGAIVTYRRALAIRPAFAEALTNLGNALRDKGRLDEAIASHRSALAIRSDFADALYNLGNAYRAADKLDEAMRQYERAIDIQPEYPEALVNLANCLRDQRKLDEAIKNYEKAIAIRPDFPAALVNLANALRDRGRMAEAAAGYHRALAIRPGFSEALSNLGSLMQDEGRLEEAAAHYRQAIAAKPDQSSAYSNLLALQAIGSHFNANAYLALAEEWERNCMTEPPVFRSSFVRQPAARRRLRVGYVSGDYWKHAVSHFAEQLFAGHDRRKVEVFAYSTSTRVDEVTIRLRRLCDHWTPVTGLNDMAAREHILGDEIDVLVDLSGHTARNRLGIFGLRAAPVQVHYLGYFASTGLSQMDYWIGDEIITPPQTDAQFRELVWRLPRVWTSYGADNEAPPTQWHAAADGRLWLGSFNGLVKLTPETIELWARVLTALPEASLLLKTRGLGDPGVCQRILESFAVYGISSDRIELSDQTVTPDWRRHMAFYDRLDIALDPVAGVGGGTTSCDALWMGVPVITLPGDRMAARMTGSMLNSIGRPEWIARDKQDYVAKVVALARDVELRQALRPGQRARMASSELCDTPGLIRVLEEAFLAMFEKWHLENR